ncbi:bacteriocin-associated integral membrane family protein [Clavibacter sp. Sh2126]|uniref:bacteriocin-associated integral membrane family protein n=1 Tax=Clavibacter sp. Sh2126 TaxID=3397678 RepID=UPI0039E16C82
MISRLLVVLCVVLTFVVAGSAAVDADMRDRAARDAVAAGWGSPFVVPVLPETTDPGIVADAFATAAQETGVSVIRQAEGVDGAQEKTTLYVLLADGSQLPSAFPLSTGRFLTPEESRGSTGSVATAAVGDPSAVGTIADLGEDDRFLIRPLRTAFDTLLPDGAYRMECRSREDCRAFLERVAALVDERAPQAALTADLLATPHSGGGSSTGGVEPVTAVVVILFLFVVILILYRQLAQARRTGVLRLHGRGTFEVWFLITGRLLLLTVGSAGAVAVAATALVPGSTVALAVVVGGAVARLLGALLVASSLTCVTIRRLRIADALKDRKDTRALFWTSTTLKAAATVALVITGATTASQVQVIRHQQELVGSWSRASGYAVFHPQAIGDDGETGGGSDLGRLANEAYDLYDELDARGALYVDASGLRTPDGPGPDGGSRGGSTHPASLVVNPAYLTAFPVLGEDGEPVVVDEEDADWTVLVPATMRGREDDLRRTFQDARRGMGQADRSLFHRDGGLDTSRQQVRIIWTQPGQRLFAFDPSVGAEDGGSVTDPVVQVMTRAGSVGFDRANMMSGGIGDALKVRLDGGSTDATLAELATTLRRLHLDDNLTHLTTLDDHQAAEVQRLDDELRLLALVGALPLVGVLVLTLQSVGLMFERSSRRIVIRRMFGHGLVRRYAEPLGVLGAIWAVQFGAALAAHASGYAGLGTATAADGSSADAGVGGVLITTAAVLAIELVVSAAWAVRLERRRTVDILKGAF